MPLYTLLKIYWSVHQKGVSFTKCELYFNKRAFKKIGGGAWRLPSQTVAGRGLCAESGWARSFLYWDSEREEDKRGPLSRVLWSTDWDPQICSPLTFPCDSPPTLAETWQVCQLLVNFLRLWCVHETSEGQMVSAQEGVQGTGWPGSSAPLRITSPFTRSFGVLEMCSSLVHMTFHKVLSRWFQVGCEQNEDLLVSIAFLWFPPIQDRSRHGLRDLGKLKINGNGDFWSRVEGHFLGSRVFSGCHQPPNAVRISVLNEHATYFPPASDLDWYWGRKT